MRHTKGADGKYHITTAKHGHKVYEHLEGSRAQVWHGTAFRTPGGLKKHDLMQNKRGRIVSVRKHKTAKKQKRLEKAGYFTKKGHFGFVKKHNKTHKKKHRKDKK